MIAKNAVVYCLRNPYTPVADIPVTLGMHLLSLHQKGNSVSGIASLTVYTLVYFQKFAEYF